MKQVKRWQNAANALLGVWIILAPWALDFQDDIAALYNFRIVGTLLLTTSLGAMFVPALWKQRTAAALGAWLAISSAILPVSEGQTPAINAILAGLVALTLALWALQDEAFDAKEDTSHYDDVL